MEQRNVTVTMPAELLKLARHLAVDEGVSLSRFVSLLVEREVTDRQAYRAAMRRQIALMHSGSSLGTRGEITWTRSELHER